MIEIRSGWSGATRCLSSAAPGNRTMSAAAVVPISPSSIFGRTSGSTLGAGKAGIAGVPRGEVELLHACAELALERAPRRLELAGPRRARHREPHRHMAGQP